MNTEPLQSAFDKIETLDLEVYNQLKVLKAGEEKLENLIKQAATAREQLNALIEEDHRPDFIVVIPPGTASKWHSPTQTLNRGAFGSKVEAETWAKKHLKGSNFSIKSVTVETV